MKIQKPQKPKSFTVGKGFPIKTKWNPKKSASAVDNVPPQSMWPIKRGSAVFAIDSRDFLTVNSGRVSWFNPARNADQSSCVSAGFPFYNVQLNADGLGGSMLVSCENVFPYTKSGWKLCLKMLASIIQKEAAESVHNGQVLFKRSEQLRQIAIEILKQVK